MTPRDRRRALPPRSTSHDPNAPSRNCGFWTRSWPPRRCCSPPNRCLPSRGRRMCRSWTPRTTTGHCRCVQGHALETVRRRWAMISLVDLFFVPRWPSDARLSRARGLSGFVSISGGYSESSAILFAVPSVVCPCGLGGGGRLSCARTWPPNGAGPFLLNGIPLFCVSIRKCAAALLVQRRWAFLEDHSSR